MKYIEATIVSDCRRYKVEIERRSGGSLQLTVYKWTEEMVPGYGKVAEFWESVSQGVTITDTLKRAEQLACEKLKLFVYPDEMPEQPATQS